MSLSITEESFDSLADYWADPSQPLKWSPLFVLPAWLKVWWQQFGSEAEPYLAAVWQGEEIIGIAPLQIKGEKAAIIGSVDVCDYLDFVVAPGREPDFFNLLLDNLRGKGVSHLDLRALRPDSTVLNHLAGIAEKRGCAVACQKEAISVELELPPTWDEYLALLNKKQRHELRRKFRRLDEVSEAGYSCSKTSQGITGQMDAFFKLFSLSRDEKADFMTPGMESFFRSMASAMAEIGLLRVGSLELAGQPVAMVIGFDYDDNLYLYNSGYDPQYNYLSVGLLSKAACIRESIEEGKKTFDLLKGDEPYKFHLGGREVPLYSCQIKFK